MIFNCDSKLVDKYSPPVLGNGDISLLIDYQGSQFQSSYYNMIPSIWWAGHRYDTPLRELVPFGHFEQDIVSSGEKVYMHKDWSQSLNVKDALVECCCLYDQGISIESKIFVHSEYNVIVVRKKFNSTQDFNYIFRYVLAQPGNDKEPPRRMAFIPKIDTDSCCIDVEYHIDGQSQYNGVISLLSNKPLKPSINGNEFAFQGNSSIEDVTFFILFVDDIDNNDYKEQSLKLKEMIKSQGFYGLLESHRGAWHDYWEQSYVNIPDQKLQSVYYASQYHLRSATTRWSIPIAIADTHWYGKYFAFDEYFSFLALLSSNHKDLAKWVPEFRYRGLDKAFRRSAKYTKDSNFKGGARYPWETVETGDEASPSGFWHDHIFHMAHVALEAWNYYLYTNDKDFLLSKGYPVIKACADFFLYQAVYEIDENKTIIGKCTDLERLGVAIQNAFMTTCGAIATLLAASESANILQTDELMSVQWRNTAYRLKESLPHDNDKYIPYPGCSEKSISVLSGIFPYGVIEPSDQKQINAIDDYCSMDVIYGNMYPVGKSICPWYAAWKAIVFARLHNQEKALAAIIQAADSAGCFSQLFEINEPTVAMRPWFSTAEGTYIQGINEMLVQSFEDQIWISPAVPGSWENYSFKLACLGGKMIEAEVKDSKICNLILYMDSDNCNKKAKIIIPYDILDKELLNKDNIASLIKADDKYVLEIIVPQEIDINIDKRIKII